MSFLGLRKKNDKSIKPRKQKKPKLNHKKLIKTIRIFKKYSVQFGFINLKLKNLNQTEPV
jgi:hypothetical protein